MTEPDTPAPADWNAAWDSGYRFGRACADAALREAAAEIARLRAGSAHPGAPTPSPEGA